MATPGAAPPLMKRSRAKLWMRTVILAIFGTLFGLALYRDIVAGTFHWLWACAVLLLSLPAGFWLSRLVPMQVHPASQHVTLSFDRIYFALILLLVIVKAIAGRISGLALLTDLIMCTILGLMVGRLSGICLRVRDLRQSMRVDGA